jgi:hypothetical protein
MLTEITAAKPLEGGCSCGQVRYQITQEPLFTHACHCTDCQRSSGSAFVVHSWIFDDFWKINGDVRATKLIAGSGADLELFFCTKCGTFIFCRNSRRPIGLVILKTFTLDDTNLLPPQAHIFTKGMKEWLSVSDHAPKFEAMYQREEIWPEESLRILETYMVT